jgi:hypothetical protein
VTNEVRGLEAAPLPADSAIVRLLLDDPHRKNLTVQYVAAWPVEVTPDRTVQALDALATQALAPGARSSQ